jgi:uncharacterized protein (DUF934 family)
MEKLIRNRRAADDNWQWLKPDAGAAPAVPAEGDVILPLVVWQSQRDALRTRNGRTAVWLEGREDPRAIAGDLAELPLVAVHFASHGDGRSMSTARLLRERYGYRGEIRAVGDVLRDQLLFMYRCGIDSFALRADQDIASALQAFDELPLTYQASAIEPLPLFRRQLPTGEPARSGEHA